MSSMVLSTSLDECNLSLPQSKSFHQSDVRRLSMTALLLSNSIEEILQPMKGIDRSKERALCSYLVLAISSAVLCARISSDFLIAFMS
mmetsp:Transcript_5936/g.8878  ORF Transcript_5936/g.8878 Transcript_5936/m.8878 type:complete len:88 (-) Transcript_5936:272-535(-)